MLIEALGPSGVGKTTVMREAANQVGVEDTWKPGLSFDESFRKKSIAWRNKVFDSAKMSDYVVWSLDSLLKTKMKPSQCLAVSAMIRTAVARRTFLLQLDDPLPIFAEELLLHRAFSFLPFVDGLRKYTTEYFNKVPLPDAAVIFDAPTDSIVTQIRKRGLSVNVYRDLTEHSLQEIVNHAREVSLTAFKVLTGRGLPVLILDTSQPTQDAAVKLNEWIERTVTKHDDRK